MISFNNKNIIYLNYFLKIKTYLILMYIIFLLDILIIIILLIKDILKYNISIRKLKNRFIQSKFNNIDVLIHGVSCGESKLTLPIIKKLKDKNLKVKLSVHTPYGYDLVKEYSNDVFLKPYDTFFITLYMFYKLRPKVIIISVSDSWPYFILFSKLFGCKIYYVNYKIKNNLLRNYYHNIISEKIYLSEQKIETKKYSYLGDLKILQNKNDVIIKKDKLRLIIASAYENEFNLHLKYIKYFLNNNNIQIIYVPRHINWLSKFKNKITNIDHKFIKTVKEIDNSNSKLLICWKIGLLNKIYSKTSICLLGDTFNTGGKNLIEPIINKNVILTGPNVTKIKHLTNFFDNIIINRNLDELILNTNKIISNKLCKKISEANYNCLLIKQKQIEKKLNKFIELIIEKVNK